MQLHGCLLYHVFYTDIFEHCFILFGASPPASMPTLVVPYTFLYYYYYITIILLLLLLRYLLNANGR